MCVLPCFLLERDSWAMLEGMSSYLEVRVGPCPRPLGDALLTPWAFVVMHASGKASTKAWSPLLLVLTQLVEHLGDKEKAEL